MSRIKIGFIISSCLVLIAVCVVPFLLNNDFETGALVSYIIAKVLIVLLLVGAIAFTLVSPSFNGSKGSILIIALLFQLVPLGLRYLLLANFDSKYVWYVVILVVTLVAFVSISFGLSEQNKKMLKRDEESLGKEIAVQEEKRLATDNKEE